VANTLDIARGSGFGYTKVSSTEDTVRGSVLWIQPGILALNAVRGSVLYCRNSMGSWLWIRKVLALDTARGPVLWIQQGAQYCGYSKGSVLWILLGILALDTARKCPTLWIKPVIRDVDTARGFCSGYSKRFSTLDTAIGSVIKIQPGVQCYGYIQEFWLWTQPWTRDSPRAWDLSRDIDTGSWIWIQSWTQIHLGLRIHLVIQIVHSRGLDLTKVLNVTKTLDLPAP
jgi:hypothetical protein